MTGRMSYRRLAPMTKFEIRERGRRHDAPGFARFQDTIEVRLGDRPVTAGNDPVPPAPHVERLDGLAWDVSRRSPAVEPGTSETIRLLIEVVTSLSARLDALESHKATR